MREVRKTRKRFSYLNNHFNKQNSTEFASLIINLRLSTRQTGEEQEIISDIFHEKSTVYQHVKHEQNPTGDRMSS